MRNVTDIKSAWNLLDGIAPRRFSTEQILKFYFIFAAISMYFTLPVPYVGEEGTYTISAMEMFFHHDYWRSTLYSGFYARPPLMNWLIIPIAELIGWKHVLIASRFVSATATVLTGVTLVWLVRTLTKNYVFAWFCGAAYFSINVLFWLGWLSYADPLMSFFIMFSLATLWVGVEKRQNRYLVMAVIAVCLGFLSKAFTPYFFYGVMGLCLLIFHPNRWFLLRPSSWLIHAFALVFPFLWGYVSDPAYIPIMWYTMVLGENNVSLLASWHTVPKYIYQVLFYQPFAFLMSLAPGSFIVLYSYHRYQFRHDKKEFYTNARIAFFVGIISFLPCWLSWDQWPEGRYYMPIFPIMAIAIAYVLWHSPEKVKRFFLIGLMVLFGAKLILGAFGFYLFYSEGRPDYGHIAKEILHDTQGAPLTVTGGGMAQILSITSAMDSLLMPNKIVPYGDVKKAKLAYQIVTADKSYMHTKAFGSNKVVKVYLSPYSSRTYYLTQLGAKRGDLFPGSGTPSLKNSCRIFHSWYVEKLAQWLYPKFVRVCKKH